MSNERNMFQDYFSKYKLKILHGFFRVTQPECPVRGIVLIAHESTQVKSDSNQVVNEDIFNS